MPLYTFNVQFQFFFEIKFIYHKTHHFNHFKAESPVIFSKFTKLYHHLLYLIPEHFYHHLNKTYLLGSLLLFPISSWQLLIGYLSLCVWLICTFHIHGITQYVGFHVVFFHLAYCFKVHIYCSNVSVFPSFYGWIIFHFMYIQQFI